MEEEFRNLGKTLQDYEAELQGLRQEEEDIDMDREDGNLFVPTNR